MHIVHTIRPSFIFLGKFLLHAMHFLGAFAISGWKIASHGPSLAKFPNDFVHSCQLLSKLYLQKQHSSLCYTNIKKSNWVILKRTSTTFTYYWNRIKKGQKYYILQNHESRKLELGDGLSRNFLLKVQKLVASSPVMQLHTFEFWCKTK